MPSDPTPSALAAARALEYACPCTISPCSHEKAVALALDAFAAERVRESNAEKVRDVLRALLGQPRDASGKGA